MRGRCKSASARTIDEGVNTDATSGNPGMAPARCLIQRLLVTCRQHEVDACTYLVDVLQRISVHPANRAIKLTPQMWNSLFADAPMRSDLGPHHHDPPPH